MRGHWVCPHLPCRSHAAATGTHAMVCTASAGGLKYAPVPPFHPPAPPVFHLPSPPQPPPTHPLLKLLPVAGAWLALHPSPWWCLCRVYVPLQALGGKQGLLSLKEDKHSGDQVVTAVNRNHELYFLLLRNTPPLLPLPPSSPIIQVVAPPILASILPRHNRQSETFDK